MTLDVVNVIVIVIIPKKKKKKKIQRVPSGSCVAERPERPEGRKETIEGLQEIK